MRAVKSNDLEKIKYILAHDPGDKTTLFDLTTYTYSTPLGLATDLREPDALILLLEHLLTLSHVEIHAAYHSKDRNGYKFYNYIQERFESNDRLQFYWAESACEPICQLPKLQNRDIN